MSKAGHRARLSEYDFLRLFFANDRLQMIDSFKLSQVEEWQKRMKKEVNCSIFL